MFFFENAVKHLAFAHQEHIVSGPEMHVFEVKIMITVYQKIQNRDFLHIMTAHVSII